LAGVAGRRGKGQRDAVVDVGAVAIAESHVVRMARTQRADAHGFGDGAGGGARQPHDADAAGARWRGDGDDGVGGGWESGHGSGNERSVVAAGSRKSEVGSRKSEVGEE